MLYDVLIFGIKRTQVWRRGLAERFPEDTRNLLAVEMLDALAKTPASEVDPAIWGQLEPFMLSRRSKEAVAAAARTVGFSERPRTMDDFLIILLDLLWAKDGQPQGAALAIGGAR